MWLSLLFACGGPAALPQPHEPPAWPLENLHVKKRAKPVVPAPVVAPPAAPPTEDEATPAPPAPPAEETTP